MGYADRDYMRPNYGPHGGGPSMAGIFSGAPVVKWLIIVNIGLILLKILMTPGGQPLSNPGALEEWGSFTIAESWQLWRWLSCQFIHADFMHATFNMIGIFFFGRHIERQLGSRLFLFFYLLSGVAGILFFTLLAIAPGFLAGVTWQTHLLGASAGVFGILAAFYVIAPNAIVYFMLIIPMKMRTFALVFFAIEVVIVLTNANNAGGSAGHLGGVIFGLLFMKQPKVRGFVERLAKLGSGKKLRTRRGKTRARTARVVRESPLDVTAEVDRILDKISEKGMQSLTKKERETLENAKRER